MTAKVVEYKNLWYAKIRIYSTSQNLYSTAWGVSKFGSLVMVTHSSGLAIEKYSNAAKESEVSWGLIGRLHS